MISTALGLSPGVGRTHPLTDAPPLSRCIPWLVQSVARTLAYRSREGQRAVVAGGIAGRGRRRPGGPSAREDECRGRRAPGDPGRAAASAQRQRQRPRFAPPPRLSRSDRTAAGRRPGLSGTAVPLRAPRDRPALAVARPRGRRGPASRSGRPATWSSRISAMPGATRSRVVPRTCRSAGSPRSGSPWPAIPSSWPRVGRSTEVVRRRFEVNEGIVGWGQGAFAALPHLVDTPLDWRGPYPAMPAGGYAAPGDAGLLGILPGSWGPAQTGVAEFGAEPDRRHRPVAARDRDPGRAGGPQPADAWSHWHRSMPVAAVVVAAVTTFRGTASPLVVEPRRTLRIDGTERGGSGEFAVDLGQVFRERPAPAPLDGRSSTDAGRRLGDADRRGGIVGGVARRPRDGAGREDLDRRGPGPGERPSG